VKEMRIDVPIPGVEVVVRSRTLVVSSSHPLKTLGSCVLGGGFSRTRYILNHQVRDDFSHSSPDRYLRKVAQELGIRERAIGMLTAAELSNLSAASLCESELKVCAIVTGGVSNAAAAGEESAKRRHGTGTINTILLMDCSLTGSAMVGAVVTATEAKTVALRELDVRSSVNQEPATGTTTDALVVACTGNGAKLRYAGTGTLLGELIGKTVKKATGESIKRQEEWG